MAHEYSRIVVVGAQGSGEQATTLVPFNLSSAIAHYRYTPLLREVYVRRWHYWGKFNQAAQSTCPFTDNTINVQIYLGTATHCPIEWTLIPGANWSATVSVAHHKPNTSATGIGFTAPKQIGDTCTSPSQLVSLLKRAEILTIYPGLDMAHIFTLNEGVIDRILASTSRITGGMIYIALKCPGILFTKEITVVDVPGQFQF